MEVHHTVSLESALRELSPNDDDGLDPLAPTDVSLERVAQSCGGYSKPATAV